MARGGEHTLLVALVVLLLFGITLGVVWWRQMQQHMQQVSPPRAWTPEALDSLGQAFLQRLQQLLNETLQQGPEAAVRVCADTAQEFTAQFARQHGISLRRVALRWRNPRNRPDSVEAFWIEQFQRWQAEGRTLDTLVVLRSAGELRLLRPIVLRSALCLMCHGSQQEIPPSIAQLIAERYPEDRARNFQLGQVRGALSIRVPEQ
ncbi:hypothetical protein HRbin21_00651 [bacterium HR21]|nr:hypothetical protein HRbin21_00651 [bacterium HR21]